jgi:hypothetical protein
MNPELDDEGFEIEAEAPETPEPTAEEKKLIAMETEARRMGWRPRDEYRGPPGQWRDAEEFLRRGQDILPIVRKDLQRERERNNNMESEIRALRTTVDEQKAVMDDLLKMARTASESGYRRAMEELNAQKRAAAQAGDVATVVSIDEKIEEIREERAASTVPVAQKPKEAAPAPAQKPAAPQEVVDFIADNPWFNTDTVLHKAMEAEHIALLEEAPGLSLEDNLRQAKDAVMARYPRKFGIDPAKKPPAPVEEEEEEVTQQTPRRRTSVSAPSAPATAQRQQKTGIASIEDPQERAVAQQAFARAKRMMPDLTESEWFSAYENPKVDVMEVRQTLKQRKEKTNGAR